MYCSSDTGLHHTFTLFLQTNTYQAVLATDGSATYVMFLYREILWGTGATSAGFNAGDGIRGFNLPEFSTAEGTLNLETTSNVAPECAGVYFFRVDQNFTIEPLLNNSGT